MTDDVLAIDMVSDLVCPWCWLGKRRLEAALALTPDVAVEISYRPFQLDASVPREGVPYSDYMRAKFDDGSGADRFKAMRDYLEAAAPEAGVTFRFGDIPLRANTLDAHRLVRWAQGQALGGEMKEALFRAYFDELRNIADPATLAELAEQVGLDGGLTAELLATDKDVREVEVEEAFFRRLGVTGVPTFIANGRLALPGAAEPGEIAQFLREAADLPPETSA